MASSQKVTSSLRLKVDVEPGTSVETAARDLVWLCKQLSVTVETSFNESPLIAKPSQSVDSVIAGWERERRLAQYPSPT